MSSLNYYRNSQTHLFEKVVSVLLECEVGGAAVVVEAVVHIFQLEDLPDLQGQVLKGNGDVGTVRIDLNITHVFSKGRNCKAPFFILISHLNTPLSIG